MYFIAHIHNNANRGGVRFMAYNVYIQQMIENFIKTLSKPVLVIKHYNVQQPSKSDFLKLLPNDTDTSCVYHEYQPDSLYEAYEPFLDWIRLFYVNFYYLTFKYFSIFSAFGSPILLEIVISNLSNISSNSL